MQFISIFKLALFLENGFGFGESFGWIMTIGALYILMTCQNAAAQILLGTKKKGHATTVLASLV